MRVFEFEVGDTVKLKRRGMTLGVVIDATKYHGCLLVEWRTGIKEWFNDYELKQA